MLRQRNMYRAINTGTTGPTGPIGSTGPTGRIGPLGTKGSTGNTGSIGRVGPIGVTGPTGLPGSASNTGATGPVGRVGSNCPRGYTGQTGPIGETGPLDLLIYSSRTRFYEATDDEGNIIVDENGHTIWYDQNDELVTIDSFPGLPIATPRNVSKSLNIGLSARVISLEKEIKELKATLNSLVTKSSS